MLKRKSSIKGRLVFLLAIIILLPVGVILFFRMEGEVPEVRLDLPADTLGVSQDVTLGIADGKSGLRSVKFTLVSGEKEAVLIDKPYPSAGLLGGGAVKEASESVKIEPKKMGFAAGKVTLTLEVYDYS